eukprot:CAMPEP_0176385824 /NCGR_PEP_ID=MMETSP0126-20121128/35454_1 /TAXON_ID=141414 ORGANISM="Strombidinopsis acuminatum, Strain SPMC142" /NCGR_SAMPLE_ID=MMETSP0126 /ASSEMBLY_ACC=CAM_ASM_000229 /LENGTH=102 /DNA_ID=CAMNT_0017752407 /DNA_START=590 /DNA_END=898 /DNA_ORIENTATION=+
MASFDIIKTFYQVDRNHPYAAIMNLWMGAAAGTVAVTITYPTDLARRKMQLSGQPGHEEFSSFLNVFTKITRQEGIKGLFKGLIPCYLKVIPSTALLFLCNE